MTEISSYDKFEDRFIYQIIWNHAYTTAGEEFLSSMVGRNGVQRIEQHSSAGEGDRWFYDVYNESGTVVRIFNPHEVQFKTPTDAR